jgi:transcriptional regulator with PAS, ATPase and Fis domain
MAEEAYDSLLAGVSTLFDSLGRTLVCLDRDFRVVHTSPSFARLTGARVEGWPAEALLGAELFGPAGTLRKALLAGERREGWGATLAPGAGAEPRQVSVTVAPVVHAPGAPCDPRIAYIAVLRPAEEGATNEAGAPTVFCGLSARSAAMRQIFRLVLNLAESEATILLTGESGTGKELVARALHQTSPRRGGPFVAVNCGALPGELLESELFGHVRGAFTGAVRDRAGRFELAAHGTLFLDEVGDLPLPLQVKLLRVLQERTFERVGESAPRRSDARIIAATHVDLKRAVLEGRFRDDLYYRLRVVPIEIPPLRSRREDIEPLARTLLARVGERHGRSLRLSPDALRALLGYPWPGNVRELENALEYAVAVTRGQTIHADDLPLEVLAAAPALPPPASAPPAPPPESPAGSAPGESERLRAAVPAERERLRAAVSAERERLRAALEAHHWRRDEAARALGISRTTLWRRMRELDLGREYGR